jgi:hypothetical protein
MRNILAACIVLALLCACAGGQTTNLQSFLGGTQGLSIVFETNAPPTEVFDGGGYPFDVAVKLQNRGEYTVAVNKAKVTISGIKASEFDKTDAFMSRSAPEQLLARSVDTAGKILEPSPLFMEFKDFNHKAAITGSILSYPIKAEVCYNYATIAVSKLCVRRNLINPGIGGICTIDGEKPLAVSGAPVQVSSMREFQRSQSSIGFTFVIKHAGTGSVFELDSLCPADRAKEDSVKVKVETGMEGLSCQRLNPESPGVVSGAVKLYGEETPITCTQTVSSPADFEMPIKMTISYDYRDEVQTTVSVKHSGS